MIRMMVDHIGKKNSNGQLAVILKTEDAESDAVYLLVWIVPYEAYAIVLTFSNRESEVPLIHDLFKSLISSSGVSVERVFIYGVSGDVFISKIFFKNSGNYFELDSRASDGIAIAMRANAPIFVAEKVLNRYGRKKNGQLIRGGSGGDSDIVKKSKKVTDSDIKKMSAFADLIEHLDIDDFIGEKD